MYRRWGARCLVVAAVASCCACTGGGESGGGPRPAARGMRVRAATVGARDVVYAVEALGSLEPDELVRVTAEVSGVVKEVLFQAGDEVTPDTVLARVDPERYRLEAERADAAHRRALADWRRAEAERERREALAREQLVADEELARSRQEAERLAADAAAAGAALEIARQNQGRAEVRPPRAGRVDTRSVDTGQFVQQGTVLATLVDLRRLRLRFRVADAESLRVQPGQAVTFRTSSLGERLFEAVVYHVGELADPATRQVEVLAWVENPGGLKPGFFAEVSLATDTHRGAVVVPEGAIRASESGFVAYVVADGVARERPVSVGLRTADGAVEVRSGLAVGEAVVTEGSDRLADGLPVEVVGPEPRGSGR